MKHWESIKVFKAEEKVAAITSIYNDLGIPKLTQEIINNYANKAFEILATISANEQAKALLVKLSEDLLVRET